MVRSSNSRPLGAPDYGLHNLTFPLSWVQKVSYRSKRQSGRAVYRHLALLCLLYCIPDAALSLFSPSLFVSVVACFVPVLLAWWRRKLLLNPRYFRLSVVAVAAVVIFFTNPSAPDLFLVWSPIQNPFALLIGGVSTTLLSTFLFFWVYSGCGVSGSSCMRLQSVVTQICFIAVRVTNFASEVW